MINPKVLFHKQIPKKNCFFLFLRRSTWNIWFYIQFHCLVKTATNYKYITCVTSFFSWNTKNPIKDYIDVLSQVSSNTKNDEQLEKKVKFQLGICEFQIIRKTWFWLIHLPVYLLLLNTTIAKSFPLLYSKANTTL